MILRQGIRDRGCSCCSARRGERAQAAPLESLYVRGPIDFYGAQGKLYANGQLFHVKGVTWYGSEGSPWCSST